MIWSPDDEMEYQKTLEKRRVAKQVILERAKQLYERTEFPQYSRSDEADMLEWVVRAGEDGGTWDEIKMLARQWAVLSRD